MPSLSFDLTGKDAVVTGASSGIGREIALELAKAGARVLLVGRDSARLDETATAIVGRDGEARILSADLTEMEAPRAVVSAAVNAFGGIDILVHSAGVYERRPFEETALETLDLQWAVNFRAPYALTQAALPYLRSESAVIFLSSAVAFAPLRNASAYCPTKAALNSLVGVLAIELAPRGIRVNAVAPGFTMTPMNEELRQDPATVEQTLSTTPAGRMGTVEDIAPAVVFLASEAAKFIYGTVLRIDGGYPTPFVVNRNQPSESP